MLRYEYPDLQPEDMPILEKFEADVLPYVLANGSEIGERAMQGDADATEVINRHRLVVEGLPHLRETNYKLLVAALKRWTQKRSN